MSILDCGDPTPENGQAITSSGTTLNEIASVTCDNGYTLNGSSVIRCLDTGWNDTTTCVINGNNLQQQFNLVKNVFTSLETYYGISHTEHKNTSNFQLSSVFKIFRKCNAGFLKGQMG